MRYRSEMERAEKYAAEDLGWRNAEALDARAAGRDGRVVGVLIAPGLHGGDPFVVAFDEAGRIATDAGDPAEFGWEEGADE